MRALVLFVCLTVCCLAERPQKCQSPDLFSGSLSMVTASERLMVFAKYTYDAKWQRIRLREYGAVDNKTFHLDMLLLFQKHVVYKINEKNQTCCKKKLCRDFHPLEVPKNATLLGQVVLGSSSGPGQGVLVNSWGGEKQLKQGGRARYMSTVTEFGCFPVSTRFHTDRTGWVEVSFFNNVLGTPEPHDLVPPPFCEDAEMEDGVEPVSFYDLF